MFSQYPAEVALRVSKNLPKTIKWLPNPSEVRAACEEDYGPMRRAMEFEERSRAQIAERAKIEEADVVESAEYRRQVVERVMGDYRKATPSLRPRTRAETVDALVTRLGVSREQWDALPDLPEKIADKNPERSDARAADFE